jgi:hypothetical protein
MGRSVGQLQQQYPVRFGGLLQLWEEARRELPRYPGHFGGLLTLWEGVWQE